MVTIEDGERAIVSFADDASDEFEVEFGDDARFVFNARGQSKLNLAYNTKYDKDFAYDYDDANIDFLTFEGEPTTNRTGTLYIYADEDSYIYEVTSKGAKKDQRCQVQPRRGSLGDPHPQPDLLCHFG